MTQCSPQHVADALLAARQQHRTLQSADHSHMLNSADDAYDAQAAVARQLGWFDINFPRYWKSGGASRESMLTHAPLPPKGVWRSPASAGDFPFHNRYIEAEIALRLGQDVNAQDAAILDEASTISRIDAMAVSIEIVDSRWIEGISAPPLLRLADLQSHGALVLGDWQPWSAQDWSQQTCRVKIGQQPVVEQSGSHPLGRPTWGLPAWLRHATRDGATVPAGTVVTTGTWVGILEAHQGDHVIVSFDGIGLAEVQL
ncbi:2-keto-4-pentenoate hydratase [Candidimonas sp. SYP-B2681]|uniref:fumarylacetoacetate hydrolase family protein n=1 Tax=Candidimonas sp. SYP-B2681 TaxID=2497686 RepID=UPI000F88966C|nr:fumarylacetoacetate hydrolase family protein [Candidimonas sp. SYP-B2681]RTZ38867.1 2-keto-4-pentenoate hydratase [Candidimonas sp. SYP-B2681]